MAQLEHMEAIEKRLWSAADTLRSNSNYASNEYFMPVMGLIFLRHAYSRFLAVKDEIKDTLPSRGGKTRELTKEDFSRKGAIFLRDKAQFDHLVALTDADDRAEAVIQAMESIESDYTNLKDQLPKSEYRELDNDVLGKLLRALNPEELKKATGDIFGRIYEYFLTCFADLKAHDGGEFFTPISLVQLIAHVIEPDHGKILDPACGSGGMFVQSAHFVERMKKNPGDLLTFYGMEKNPTTIRLAKMNLAVHGLEGNIQKAISYYEDPHTGLWGKADYVMANPPFNVDEVDSEKIKTDVGRRLPFGLPGVNKAKKVSNGNYLPEQLQNITSIIWLYRGETSRFVELVQSYIDQTLAEADQSLAPLEKFHKAMAVLFDTMAPFLKSLPDNGIHSETHDELKTALDDVKDSIKAFERTKTKAGKEWREGRFVNAPELFRFIETGQTLAALADQSRDMIKLLDHGFKTMVRLIDLCEKDLNAKASDLWNATEINGSRKNTLKKQAESARKDAVDQVRQVRYFYKQAAWLLSRFPEGKLTDVEGLVKLVSLKDLEANDWSLTPGRYVGVAPEVVDDDFDFEEALRDIHTELAGLNEEAVRLAGQIATNFEGLGI